MIRPVSLSLLLMLFIALPTDAGEINEELWAAAKNGDAKIVETLLTEGADVNAKTSYGQTALWFAAGKGHQEAVKVLVNHKANVNAKDTFYGTSPLTQALAGNHAEVVKALLDAGTEGADAALLGAVQSRKKEIVQAILEKGKVKPETLTSALTAADATGKEIADLLTKAGAKAAPTTPPFSVDLETLKAYAGAYESPTQFELNLTLKDGKLVALYAEQVLYTLIPIDKTSFKAGGNATITFKGEGDKVTGFTMKSDTFEQAYKRLGPRREPVVKTEPAKVEEGPVTVASPMNWPSFRGPHASGVADGQKPLTSWDAEKSINILWKTPIPGLGHSCPIVWEDRIYLTTAISGDPNTKLRVGLYGDVDSVNDTTYHSWRVYCLDKRSGKILWERIPCGGVPKIKRHMKSTHANCTPATDGQYLVAFFGSEGLYCYDRDGRLLWKRDLGVLDASWFFDADYQWGFGSSPIIYRNLVILQCDVGKNSFIAAYNLSDGQPVWQTPREEIASWGTPTIYEGKRRTELITNATKFVRSYDPFTGKELWRLSRNAEITVPTPVASRDLIFVTSGYRPVQPIYAIRPGATGDISLKESKESNDHIAWSTKVGGPYMPTPIVYGKHLYTCSNDGMVTCYEAETGKKIYRERLRGKGGYTASPVAADGKLYFTGEESGIRVVKAGPSFEILSINPMGDVCMATPAISGGMIIVRTQHFMFGIGRKEMVKVGY